MDGVLDEPRRRLVGAEATESHPLLDVEDLDSPGEVGGGEKGSVGAEGDGGDDVFEGEAAGGGESIGGEEGDGGGVRDGEGVGVDRGEGDGGDGGYEVGD